MSPQQSKKPDHQSRSPFNALNKITRSRKVLSLANKMLPRSQLITTKSFIPPYSITLLVGHFRSNQSNSPTA